MPSQDQLQEFSGQLLAITKQLEAIAHQTELTMTAQSILSCPDTPMKELIKRKLLRLVAVRQRLPKLQQTIDECADIFTDLSQK